MTVEGKGWDLPCSSRSELRSLTFYWRHRVITEGTLEALTLTLISTTVSITYLYGDTEEVKSLSTSSHLTTDHVTMT